jgi:hypothetical protein
MAERMSKAEREQLDAEVLAKVRAGAHPHDVEGPLDRFFQNKIEASVARLRRAGTIAYDHAARRYVEGAPGAEKPARGPGRSVKSSAKPKARAGLIKARGQSKYGTSPKKWSAKGSGKAAG